MPNRPGFGPQDNASGNQQGSSRGSSESPSAGGFWISSSTALHHGQATLMLTAAEHLKVVSEQLAHSTIGFVGDLHTHISPESDEIRQQTGQAPASFIQRSGLNLAGLPEAREASRRSRCTSTRYVLGTPWKRPQRVEPPIHQ
jgi:hypothetical protein